MRNPNTSIFRLRNILPRGKKKYMVLALLAFMPLIAILLSIGVTLISSNLPFDINSMAAILPVFYKISIYSFMFAVVAYFFGKTISSFSIIIDEIGIQRVAPSSLSFLNFNIKWYEIDSIDVSRKDKALVIHYNHRDKPVKIQLFAWLLDKSSIELKFKKISITKFDILKFDVLDTPVMIAVKHWVEGSKNIQIFDQSYIFRKMENLGRKIRLLANLSVVVFGLSLMLLAINQQVYLAESFYWNTAFKFIILFFAIGAIVINKEFKDKSKQMGAILTSLLFAITCTYTSNEIFHTYTKFYGDKVSRELELIYRDEKIMHWQNTTENWKLLKYGIHNKFEKKIQIGSIISITTNKGPFGIYTSTFDEIDDAIAVYHKVD